MATTSPDSVDDGIKRSRILRQELQRISEQARQRYPILEHQDAIGLTILIGSAAAIVGLAVAYGYSLLPAWTVIVLSAFFLSLLHELEHDLIHRLYFKEKPWLYNAAMATVWLFRPNTINPWVRRDWHLHHHRVSGTAGDIEERGLTNGERWGIRRFFMLSDGLLALVLRPLTIRDMLVEYAGDHKLTGGAFWRGTVRNVLAYFPFGPIFIALWYWCLFLHADHFVRNVMGLPWEPSQLTVSALPILDFLAVTVLAPNALRVACLYFVSSNIHYYGDVEPRNVIQQTQVWTSAWMVPFQLFCFNFGSTHAIHHFAVQYPFYWRQMIAGDAHRVMREQGVRFNDFASMRRGNNWHSAAPVNNITPAAPASDAEAPWPQAANDG